MEGEEAQKQRKEREREKGMGEETTHSAEEGVAEKHERTDCCGLCQGS